ncbi:MAG: tetratricopeptide repeat protein, partial [Myxococcota bacterium]|nr:tetratricopeptide repeat protein [Myxococcota bacterium]
MIRLRFAPTLVLLSLYGLAPIVTDDYVGTSWAEEDGDKSDRETRRILRASDFSQQEISEAYRQAAREKRHESMKFLKEILSERDPQGEQKAEMLLRLADLYFEEGRDIYLTEMLAFEKEYDACFNTPSCNAETMEADNTQSRKWQDRSIKLYRQILASYPQYARADEATFYLASALQDTGQPQPAVKEFTRLVKSYP